MNLYQLADIAQGQLIGNKKKQITNCKSILNATQSDVTFILDKTTIESSKKSKWVITFLSGYLTEGCHDISIVGIKDSKLFSMKQEISICKNNEL